VLINVPSGDDMLTSLLVMPDGTIVAAGQVSGQIGTVALRPAGTLLGSVKVYPPPGVSSSIATSIASDSSGRLFLAGTSGSGFSTNFILACLRPFNVALNALDTTFGSGGFVITPFGATSSASRVLVQTDGKILVAGNVAQGQANIGLARYNADGSTDLAFGTQGLVVAALSTGVTVADMVLQSDGKILVAGTTAGSGAPSGFAARFTTNGIFDPQFNAVGYSFFAPHSGSQTVSQLLLLPTGNVLAGGSAVTGDDPDPDFALSRIVTSGASITIDPASDSGVNHTDGITNVTNPIFDVLGRGTNYYPRLSRRKPDQRPLRNRRHLSHRPGPGNLHVYARRRRRQ